MSDMSIEIDLRDIYSGATEFTNEMKKEVRSALHKTGEFEKALAKRYVGKDTHMLEKSMACKTEIKKDSVILEVSANTDYAYYHHEMNTRGNKGYKYLQRAMIDSQHTLKDLLGIS